MYSSLSMNRPNIGGIVMAATPSARAHCEHESQCRVYPRKNIRRLASSVEWSRFTRHLAAEIHASLGAGRFEPLDDVGAIDPHMAAAAKARTRSSGSVIESSW